MVIKVYQTDEDIPNFCCNVFRSLVQEYVTNAAKAKRTEKKQELDSEGSEKVYKIIPKYCVQNFPASKC